MDFWRRGVQDVAVSPQSTNAPVADSGVALVTRRNANTRAYLLLKQAVLSGSFRPAQVITLRMMTEFLGLGEMPAREALKRLISEGAFTAMPNRSARVPALHPREVAPPFSFRLPLLPHAARFSPLQL